MIRCRLLGHEVVSRIEFVSSTSLEYVHTSDYCARCHRDLDVYTGEVLRGPQQSWQEAVAKLKARFHA